MQITSVSSKLWLLRIIQLWIAVVSFLISRRFTFSNVFQSGSGLIQFIRYILRSTVLGLRFFYILSSNEEHAHASRRFYDSSMNVHVYSLKGKTVEISLLCHIKHLTPEY